jgi:ketosteroid isomerase-like protein
MKKLVFLLALIQFMAYSQNIIDADKGKQEIKQADIEFSDLSKEKGMRDAFLAYIAEDGVLLRPYMMPVEGFIDVKKFLDEGNTDFLLTWFPLFADISISGELGYTYGTYELTYKDEKGISVTRKGTYVSIWKKDKEGKWKFVLDTGNPGLEPKN